MTNKKEFGWDPFEKLHALGSERGSSTSSKAVRNMEILGDARGVMVIVVGNGHDDMNSNPGRDCISHSTNTLGKGMNPIILPPAMGK